MAAVPVPDSPPEPIPLQANAEDYKENSEDGLQVSNSQTTLPVRTQSSDLLYDLPEETAVRNASRESIGSLRACAPANTASEERVPVSHAALDIRESGDAASLSSDSTWRPENGGHSGDACAELYNVNGSAEPEETTQQRSEQRRENPPHSMLVQAVRSRSSLLLSQSINKLNDSGMIEQPDEKNPSGQETPAKSSSSFAVDPKTYEDTLLHFLDIGANHKSPSANTLPAIIEYSSQISSEGNEKDAPSEYSLSSKCSVEKAEQIPCTDDLIQFAETRSISKSKANEEKIAAEPIPSPTSAIVEAPSDQKCWNEPIIQILEPTGDKTKPDYSFQAISEQKSSVEVSSNSTNANIPAPNDVNQNSAIPNLYPENIQQLFSTLSASAELSHTFSTQGIKSTMDALLSNKDEIEFGLMDGRKVSAPPSPPPPTPVIQNSNTSVSKVAAAQSTKERKVKPSSKLPLKMSNTHISAKGLSAGKLGGSTLSIESSATTDDICVTSAKTARPTSAQSVRSTSTAHMTNTKSHLSNKTGTRARLFNTTSATSPKHDPNLSSQKTNPQPSSSKTRSILTREKSILGAEESSAQNKSNNSRLANKAVTQKHSQNSPLLDINKEKSSQLKGSKNYDSGKQLVGLNLRKPPSGSGEETVPPLPFAALEIPRDGEVFVQRIKDVMKSISEQKDEFTKELIARYMKLIEGLSNVGDERVTSILSQAVPFASQVHQKQMHVLLELEMQMEKAVQIVGEMWAEANNARMLLETENKGHLDNIANYSADLEKERFHTEKLKANKLTADNNLKVQRAKIKELESKAESDDIKIKDLQNTINSLNEKVRSHATVVKDRERAAKAAVKQEVEALRNKVAEMTQNKFDKAEDEKKVKTLLVELRNVKENLETESSLRKKAEGSLTNMEQTQKRMYQDIQTLQKELEAERTERHFLQKELQTLQTTSVDPAEASELRGRLQDMTSLLQLRENQLKDQEAEIKELKTVSPEIIARDKEVQKLKETMDCLLAQNQALEDELSEKNKETMKFDKVYGVQENILQIREQLIEALKVPDTDHHDRNERNLIGMRKTLDRRHLRIKALEGHVEDLERQQELLQGHRTRLEKRIAELEHALAQAKGPRCHIWGSETVPPVRRKVGTARGRFTVPEPQYG